jgi:queuine tRNA-ribosyltransferase
MNVRLIPDYRYTALDEMTHRWLDRCVDHLDKVPVKYGYEQAFPIVQGSCYKDLRQQSAEYITNSNQVGNAIGGLSVGEPAEEMYAMTEIVCEILPEDKPVT